MKPTLILTRSVSGAGKSTFAEFIKNGWGDSSDVGICCADDYFIKDGEYKFDQNELNQAHNYCKNKFNCFIKEGVPVIIVSNTNTKESEFKFYENYARDNGYRVMHIVLENRHGSDDVHGVPSLVKERQKENITKSLKL